MSRVKNESTIIWLPNHTIDIGERVTKLIGDVDNMIDTDKETWYRCPAHAIEANPPNKTRWWSDTKVDFLYKYVTIFGIR